MGCSTTKRTLFGMDYLSFYCMTAILPKNLKNNRKI